LAVVKQAVVYSAHACIPYILLQPRITRELWVFYAGFTYRNNLEALPQLVIDKPFHFKFSALSLGTIHYGDGT